MGGNRNFAGRDSVSRDDNASGYNNRNSERDTRDFSSVDRGKRIAFRNERLCQTNFLSQQPKASHRMRDSIIDADADKRTLLAIVSRYFPVVM